MKKIGFIVLLILILVGGGFLLMKVRGASQGQAVLKVHATPTVSVFVDNQNVGKTPLEQKMAAGEYTIKLVPETTVGSVTSWETKVKLTAGVVTFVNRNLGDSELTSGGEVLWLEKISGKQAELTVISTPDGASVSLDGESKGTTPLTLQELEPGSFDLSVSSPGFGTRTIKIKMTAGYKLNASFNLPMTGEVVVQVSPSPEPDGSPEATPKGSPKSSPTGTPKPSGSPTAKNSPPAKPYVEILDTPTGFLRVRAEPSTSAEEVSRVNPGEFYPLLDEENGWYKIEYAADKEGWISSQYAKKFE